MSVERRNLINKEMVGGRCSHAKEAIAWRNSVNDVSINDKEVRQKNKNCEKNVKILMQSWYTTAKE